jgi:osmotically-inducible protein OsmY
MGEGIKSAFGMSDRERMRGPHFGKGPKGFKRSDERIREDVSEAIARQGWIDASDVEVRVQSGEVTLSGTIVHRDHKRMIERMIEDLPGVVDVHNEIRIRRMVEGVGTSEEVYDPSRGIGRNVRHS